MKSDILPAHLVAPLVRDYVQREEVTGIGPVSHVEDLSGKVGMSVDVIKRLSCGTKKTVTFFEADRLITTIAGPHFWFENDELRRVYEAT